MNAETRRLRPPVKGLVALALGLLMFGGCAEKEDLRSEFAQAVDLEDWGRLAVHHEGRIKSFDSFARTMMSYVTGPRLIAGQSPAFTYLDLAFRPASYLDTDVLFIKNKPTRGRIVRTLQSEAVSAQPGFTARMDAFVETGLISPQLLNMPAVNDLLEIMRQDLMRTARFVTMIDNAKAVARPDVLHRMLRMVAPPGGTFETPWLALQEMGPSFAGDPRVAGVGAREQLAEDYGRLQAAWAAQDAERVNGALAALSSVLPTIEPALYPDADRLSWESWYFKAKSMTWVWLLYMPALVLLLLSLVYRWPTARRLGMGVFLVAFGFHTFALGLRWYVSGRWPNSNMFEAVTTAAWFGGIVALVCEFVVRRSAMRNVFALGSAAASMAALMAVHFLPTDLSPNIGNMMPVLHNVWLYIHTNIIIASYCLIFMAAISALLYLGYRVFGGRADFVRMGGAGTLIAGDGLPADTGDKAASPGQVMDGVTMVLMELSFVMLWAGLVMGAIWADHSWGRPWGWDPKEVFALNTFLVFAVLVHVRLKSRDKGLWTAVLAVVGAGVMLFNWIVINFWITGLHSYA